MYNLYLSYYGNVGDWDSLMKWLTIIKSKGFMPNHNSLHFLVYGALHSNKIREMKDLWLVRGISGVFLSSFLV